MPRRPAKIERDIPLWLIPGIVKRGVVTHGKTLERVIVSKSRNHFYNVSIRTKPIRKERKGSSARCGEGEPIGHDPHDTRPDDGSRGEPE